MEYEEKYISYILSTYFSFHQMSLKAWVVAKKLLINEFRSSELQFQTGRTTEILERHFRETWVMVHDLCVM